MLRLAWSCGIAFYVCAKMAMHFPDMWAVWGTALASTLIIFSVFGYTRER